MNANEAIRNLELMSAALEKAANSPTNYNTPYANHLEVLSWEMFRHANDLRELSGDYGDFMKCK